MQEWDYKHCLASVVVLATLLYVTPSYGILLSVGAIIVLAFASGVALLALVFYICEQCANEVTGMAKKEKRVAAKATLSN